METIGWVSVATATVVFIPGVLLRIATQKAIAAGLGVEMAHRQFGSALGGEAYISARRRYGHVYVALLTLAALVGVGTLLLVPAMVKFGLLDVRPFAALSHDPRLVISTSTPVKPWFDLVDRFGAAESLKLWVGFSCLYCSTPSSGVLGKAWAELRTVGDVRWRWVLIGPPMAVLSTLRKLDNALTFALAGAYLASGLAISIAIWFTGSTLAHLLI